MKILKIYDYADRITEVDLPDKEIKTISVSIVSGDEVVSIVYIDDTLDFYDSSKTRADNINNGHYIVKGRDIEKFINWKPKLSGYHSHERYMDFAL